MKPTTENEFYEHRIKTIISALLKDTGAELSDFKSTDELLDYLHDSADTLGRLLVEDMTEWADDWLDIIK